MNVPIWLWIALLAVIGVMLVVDLFMHRDGHEIAPKEAAAWSIGWLAMGLGVGGWIWWQYGSEFGMQYLAGYIIEKSLAVDNVFVWALIFTAFAVPRNLQHRVLFYGVLGALVLRGGFIAAGSAAISSAGWVLYLFGGFLVFTGIKLLRPGAHATDPQEYRSLKLFKRLVPSTDKYDGQRFFTRENGKRLATPLLAVLVVVETTDVIFAVDSIPAVFAVTQEPFLVFASNALALLGLRAMFFLLADLMHRFVYLKTGLALVLVWVGFKMIASHAGMKIDTGLSLGIVIGILAVSIFASLRSTRLKPASVTESAQEVL